MKPSSINLLRIIKEAKYTHCYFNPDWLDFFFDYPDSHLHGIDRHYSQYIVNHYILVLK